MVFDCGLELDDAKLDEVCDRIYRTYPIRDFKWYHQKYNRSDGPWLETTLTFRLSGLGNYGVKVILGPPDLQKTVVSVYDQLLIRLNSEMKSFLNRLGVI